MPPRGDFLGFLIDQPRRWWRRHWLAIPLCLILTYFGYHGIHGNRGLVAWIDLSHDIGGLEDELAALHAQRMQTQDLIEGLEPARLDNDLLQEELRRLGYIESDELLVMQP